MSFFSSSTCEMIMSRYTGTYFEQPGCADTLLGNSMGNWYCRGYGAARCELYPCIRSYEGAVKNGKLQERQLDTAHSWSYSSAAFEPAVTLDTNCLSMKERINLVKHGYDLRDDTQWLAFNNSIDATTGKWSDPSGVQVNPACIYQIGYLVMSSVAGFLPTWLSWTNQVCGRLHRRSIQPANSVRTRLPHLRRRKLHVRKHYKGDDRVHPTSWQPQLH